MENAAEGFKVGAFLGLQLSLYFGFIMLDTMNTSTMTAALVAAVVSLMYLGTTGAVATAVLRR